MMKPNPHSPAWLDAPVPVRIKLSALWTSLMLCYLYGDYFGLYKPGKLQRVIEGAGPFGPVNQRDLVLAALLLAVPALMVFLSLVLSLKPVRWLNIVLGLFYAAVMIVTLPGAWWFYWMLGVIEIVLSLAIVAHAWRWPKAAPAHSVSS